MLPASNEPAISLNWVHVKLMSWDHLLLACCCPWSWSFQSAQTTLSCQEHVDKFSLYVRCLITSSSLMSLQPKVSWSNRHLWYVVNHWVQRIHNDQGSQHRIVTKAVGFWKGKKKRGLNEIEAQSKFRKEKEKTDTPVNSSFGAGGAGWITAATERAL